MEHHSFSSHPNSGNSSPQSRELLDNDNRSSFDELPLSSNGYKVKLMISYGGKIQPRSHDNHFSYIGGDTKILAVDRTVKLSTLIVKLSSMANSDVCFKYQLPGEDLDALISVTNEEDLDQMMIEYDRLFRASPKPARMRLFIFPIPNKNANASSGSSASAINLTAAEDSKSEGNWFVEALNSVHVQPLEDSSPPPTTNPDYLFGLDKPYSAANQAEFPATVPDFAAKDMECGPETVRETEIHEVQAANNEQQMKSDGEKGRINGDVDCYTTEKVTPLVTNVPAHHTQVQLHSGSIPVHVRGPVPVHVSGTVPVHVSGPVPVQSSLSPERYNVASGYSMGYPNEVSPVYLIQTASGFYQAVRPVTGPTGQPVYFAYSPIVNNVAYSNGSDLPDVVSERGYSYFPDRSALPRQAAAPGGDGWN